MSCTTLTSITKGCDGNIGGITQVLINDQANITAITETDATWTIDAMTTTGSGFFPFEIRRNSGNYTEEESNDLVKGSQFVTATITLMFSRREASKSRSLKILGEGQRDLAVIIKDANEKYWYFPNAQLSAVTEGSGTAKADGSSYSVVLLAENLYLAKEVDADIIAGLID
jgi:hypothetical protein